MGGVEMIPAPLAGLSCGREGRCGEKPLPDEFARRVLVFPFHLPRQEHPRIPCRQILAAQPADDFELLPDRRQLGEISVNRP